MEASDSNIKIGQKYRINSFVPGLFVIGEVVEVEKHYLMTFIDLNGNPASGFFKEKHLSPVTMSDLGMTVGHIVGKSLGESFKNKLREEKLLAPEAGVFSDKMRHAIREEIAAFHSVDKFLSAGARV